MCFIFAKVALKDSLSKLYNKYTNYLPVIAIRVNRVTITVLQITISE